MADVCKFKAGGLVFEIDAKNEKALFERVAHIQEVFDQKCGKCGNENVKYVVRTIEDNAYFEMRCPECFARLSYGQHKSGSTLFPKRKDTEGNYLADKGWLKWDKDQGKEV